MCSETDGAACTGRIVHLWGEGEEGSSAAWGLEQVGPEVCAKTHNCMHWRDHAPGRGGGG